MSASANVSGSDDQMDIEEDETNQPIDPMFQKGPTMFNRPPPKLFGQNPMPSNDFPNDNRGPSFDDLNNSGNSSHERDGGDMKDFRSRGAERDRDSRNRGNRRDYSNERIGGGRNNSRWSDGRGRSRENDRITPADGNSRDFSNSRNNMQWRDSPNQMNFNNSYMDQSNPRMSMGGGPPPLDDMRLPIPVDNLRGGPMGPGPGPNCKLFCPIHFFRNELFSLLDF